MPLTRKAVLAESGDPLSEFLESFRDLNCAAVVCVCIAGSETEARQVSWLLAASMLIRYPGERGTSEWAGVGS